MSTQTHRSGPLSSHTQEPLATVRHSIVVPVPVEAAFSAFTEQFDLIKPREHNLLGVEIAETVFERQVGGCLYDRGVDGSECRWARVLAYEPPQRIVISWDISPQWQIETDRERASEVEIRFLAEGDDRTTVQLEHRNLDRHGDGWQMLRDGIAGGDGWPLYLQRFAELISDR
jgi:uncharacterized protein YndB with AHSA1/START domain